MALNPLFLVDKSVLARAHLPAVANQLGVLARAGLVATCSIIDLELGYSARNHGDHSLITSQRRALPLAPLTQSVFDRALEVQGLLAQTGQHRVPLPDLVIAACAEQNELTVMHYDRDFDVIAQITGQETQWVAHRGSL